MNLKNLYMVVMLLKALKGLAKGAFLGILLLADLIQ